MIKLTDIKKTYSNGVTAVKDLDITIESGKIIGFLGPNGAGKTTTLKIITGIIKPDTGTININGYRMDTQAIEAKMEMGFVSDDADVFLRLKGIEYLNFMADIYGVSQEDRTSRIKDMSIRLEMDKALKDKILGYSHGMRQKIVIMGALIHNPNVWILDEPLTGLDPKSSFVLKQMMREHADNGNTVFFSTHVLEVAEKICDEVFIINNGQIQFHGNMESLKAVQKNDDSLENLFLEMTRDA
ncbi:MAG: ABC transporter ATP-binding protein [Clostridia bacterium]|nr:ABC transporter ATP-binding protein [Clostridia bacterium]